MIRKTILVITFATVFAISMIVAVPLADAAGHIFIKKTDVKVKDLKKLDVKIKVTAAIPTTGGAGAFGYGIITDGAAAANNVLALTTHLGVLDHSSQSGAADPVFHAHVLDLAAPGSIGDPCSPLLFNAVVDFASTIGSGNNIDAKYKVKVDGDKIEVKKAKVADLNDAGVEGIVAFIIVPDTTPDFSTIPLGTTPSPLPFLCLNIVGIGIAP